METWRSPLIVANEARGQCGAAYCCENDESKRREGYSCEEGNLEGEVPLRSFVDSRNPEEYIEPKAGSRSHEFQRVSGRAHSRDGVPRVGLSARRERAV